MNKPEIGFPDQSPYQRPGSSIGKQTFNPFHSDYNMDNNSRFPVCRNPQPQREQMVPTKSLFNNSPATPSYGCSNNFMQSEFPPNGYPYFQNSYDNTVFSSETHPSPFITQDCNLYTKPVNTYQSRYDDVSSQKDQFFEDFLFQNEFNPTPKTQTPREFMPTHVAQMSKEFKPIASTPMSNKSSQQVRLNEAKRENNIPMKKTDPTPNKEMNAMQTKAQQRRQENMKSLRILSGSIDKIMKWQKLRESFNLLFDVIGTLVAIRPGKHRFEKMLLLRDQATPALQCVYCEIDRQLPPLEKGQLVRCFGKLVSKSKLVAYSVRPSSSTEKSGLQRLSFISQRAVTAMELVTPEP